MRHRLPALTPPTSPVPGRTLVIGVLNVTPDSFSDGGKYLDREAAVARGLRMCEEGADLVDVGGESTRPGAGRVGPEEELARVVPVVADLVSAGVRVSVDTSRRQVAEAAVERGAVLVNDVTGGRGDPSLLRFVATSGVGYVLMHSRGTSADMQRRAHYADVVDDVLAELHRALDAACDAGVDPDQVVIDPGLGFAKLAEHNWQILACLGRFTELGRPVLVGASRKSFLGGSALEPEGLPRDVRERDSATAAVSALAAAAGMWGVRVHDVSRSIEAVRVGVAVRRARPTSDFAPANAVMTQS